ncbi:MAG: hypothetical protein KDB02_06950 [Acidimicrobiales bacterium]|nr:hypothetical protein [Acidimicrobiales bacterium]
MPSFPPLPARVLIAPTKEGAVAYDLDARELHVLNRTGAAVAAACAGGVDRDGQIAEWASQTGADPKVIEADVDAVLESFSDLGITGSRPPRELFLAEAAAPPGSVTSTDSWLVIPAAEHRIRIVGDDRDLIDTIAALFALPARHGRPDSHVDEDEASDAEHGASPFEVDPDPTAEFLIRRADDGTYSLTTDTTVSLPNPTAVLDNFIGAFNYFVSRSATHPILHAAALTDPLGRVVLFPADRNKGKSTLTAALVQRGWTYLTDESAAIGPDDLAVLPCAKPLTLDRASRRALGLREDGSDDVALAEVAAGAVAWSGPAGAPDLVILPSFDPESEPARDRVTGSEAIATLVENTLNLFLVGSDGLRALVRVADRSPVHRITYPDRESAIALVDRVLAEV